MGRFINGDDRLVDNGNMFAYCGNNPVVNVDPRGAAYRIIDRCGYGYSDESWVPPSDLVSQDDEGTDWTDKPFAPVPWTDEPWVPANRGNELSLEEYMHAIGMSTLSQGIMFSFNSNIYQESIIIGLSGDLKSNITPFVSVGHGSSYGIPGAGISKVIIFTDAETIDDLDGAAYSDGKAVGVGPIGINGEIGHTIGEKEYNIKSISAGFGIGGGIQSYSEDSYTWNLFEPWNK